MDVQPYMIDVEYDETVERFDGTDAAIQHIVIADRLKRDIDKNGRDTWYTYNHFYREITRTFGTEQRMLQIGFQLEQTEQSDVHETIEQSKHTNSEEIAVYLVPLHDRVDPIALDYDEKHDIWFEKIKYQISTHEKTKKQRLVRKPLKITGIVDAGTIKLVVKQNGSNVYEAYVHFLPSSLSKQDYDLMLTDLFRINEQLFRADSNVAIGNKKHHQIEQLQSIMKELESPIYTINSQPHAALTFQWNKEKYNRNAKFRMRTEIERQMNPGKHKVSVFQPHETTQIIENEMIKTELIRLKKYCEFYAEDKLLKADQQQLNRETNMTIKKLGGNLRNKLMNVGALKESGQIIEEELAEYYKTLINEKENNNQALNELIKEQLNRIANLNERLSPVHTTAVVELSITLHSDQFKQNIALSNLSNSIKSEYCNIYAENAITFNGYRYKTYNESYSSPYIYSKYVNIHVHTKQIEEHAKLANLFEYAKTELAQQTDSSSVNITIEGNVVYDTRKANPDGDIIGVKDDRYSYAEIRNYTFTFTNITGATIDNNEVDLTMIEEDATSKIMPYLLTNINKTKFIQLDAKQETLQHEIHLISHLLTECKKHNKETINARHFGKIAQTIDEWLQLPVFRTIHTSGLERLKPTQLFLHDPTYLIVWNLMNQIDESIDLTLIPDFGELRFGVKKMHEIYETWVLYKMIHILTEDMGWKIKDKTNAQQYFLNFVSQSNRKSLHHFTITLTQRNWKIIIYHEPRINLKHSTYYKPDYTFQFFHDGDQIGNAYIDAKYRNYIEQGSSENEQIARKNAEKIWNSDIEDTAIEKYGNINAEKPEWNKDTLASFIIHPDITFGMRKELSGENYHIYYNDELHPGMITGDQENVHKYGSIYMTPSAIYPFKNWIRMVMEFHIGAYDKCWTCGSENVEEKVKYTISNFPKFYYTCLDCNDTFWVKTHCRKGHTIIKYVNTYHKRADRNDRWHIVCPTCEDKFENANIEI